MAELNRLTALKVAKITQPGRYGDGGGLYLRVAEYSTKAGTARSKNWIFRYERGGSERHMGLGSIADLSLADARDKARECRRALLDGADPIDLRRVHRQREKSDAAKAMTFKAAAEAYIKAHRSGWKNAKHAKQWATSLNSYVYPTIGGFDVNAIDTTSVLKCLQPIWLEIPETAGRVRGRIERILDWAKARGYREGENAARWRGHLVNLLPKRSKRRTVRHHPALPYADMPAFMALLRTRSDVSSRALEFTILTVARTNETIGAKWPEINLKEKVWVIPPERMKGAREHIVPLCDRAIQILKMLPRVSGNGGYLFPGARAGKGLSNMAMLELVRGLRLGYTVHGFRSSFRDWAGDRTNHARDVIEAALAHAIADETEAAYRRSTAVEKRRRLMADWSKYCASTGTHTSRGRS